MNRAEFMRRLAQALRDMPAEERRRALEYYENYFDEAGPENEAEVLRTLGAPEKVAADILRDYYENTEGQQPRTAKQRTDSIRNRFQTMDSGQKLLVLLLVCIALVGIVPVSVGIIGGVGGVLIALVCVVLAVFLIVPALALAAWGCTIGFAVAAGVNVMSNPALALCFIGIALICAALGILLWQLTIYLFRTTFPALIRGIADFFRRILHWNP